MSKAFSDILRYHFLHSQRGCLSSSRMEKEMVTIFRCHSWRSNSESSTMPSFSTSNYCGQYCYYLLACKLRFLICYIWLRCKQCEIKNSRLEKEIKIIYSLMTIEYLVTTCCYCKFRSIGNYIPIFDIDIVLGFHFYWFN